MPTRSSMSPPSPASPKGVLPEDRGVGVVGDEDRYVERCREPLGQRRVGPAQVGRVDDHAGGVDDPGSADADAEHWAGGEAEELPDEVVEQIDGALPAPALHGTGAALLDLAGEI